MIIKTKGKVHKMGKMIRGTSYIGDYLLGDTPN